MRVHVTIHFSCARLIWTLLMAISSYATLQIGLMLAYNLRENATAFDYVTVFSNSVALRAGWPFIHMQKDF